MDETTDAEAVPSAAQAHSAAAQSAGAGRSTGISGRNPARHDTASCTPSEDPSRQLQFGKPLHPSLPHSGVSVMSHGQNTHASAGAAGYRQFSHGGDARPLHYVH
eukprot:1459446-Pleurochrysis_carterae.AAC.1